MSGPSKDCTNIGTCELVTEKKKKKERLKLNKKYEYFIGFIFHL